VQPTVTDLTAGYTIKGRPSYAEKTQIVRILLFLRETCNRDYYIYNKKNNHIFFKKINIIQIARFSGK
jgi:hypothetical protein